MILFKYRVTYGPVHAGAMYKFADGSGGCNYTGTLTAPKGTAQQCFAPNNDAAQFNLGGVYGELSVDAVGGYYHQATIMAGGNAPLSSAQLTNSTFTPTSGPVVTSTGNNLNTLNGIITDTAGAAIAAKYTWTQFKFFVGYDYENLNNPHDNLGIGATNDQGGYALSQANNHFYAHARTLQTVWTGVKYAYDPKTDITLAYYHTSQNQYGDAGADRDLQRRYPECESRSMRGNARRGLALWRLPFHQALRCLRWHGSFERQRRPCGRHLAVGLEGRDGSLVSQSWQQLLHQLGSDHRRSLHLLIAFSGLQRRFSLNQNPASLGSRDFLRLTAFSARSSGIETELQQNGSERGKGEINASHWLTNIIDLIP